MSPGVIVLIVALALAIGAGAVWRRGNGRMRSVGDRGAGRGKPVPGMGQGQDDRSAADPTSPAGSLPDRAAAGTVVLTSDELGSALGERATLVQFSSAFCSPCRATRRILTDVAAMTEGVAHIEIDAESRLDLVRSLNVLRTPTVFITDAAGRVVKRASGQPRKADVIAAVGEAVADKIPTYLIGKEDSDSSTRPA